MTDTQFKHNALIVTGIAVVIFIFLWLMKQPQTATVDGAQVPSVTSAPGVAFIPGQGNAGGNVSFPGGSFSIPAAPLNTGSISPGPSCCDTCNGSGGLTNLSLPNQNQQYQQLGAQLQAANDAAIQGALSVMGYPEQIFVSNATPIAGFG